MSSGSVTDVTGTHIIQDEECILLNCPHEHLVRLRTQQQLIFPPQFEDGPARLRTNLIFLVLPLLQLSAQPCSLDFSSDFLVWLQAFIQASAQMPTRGINSDVTLPYLITHILVNLWEFLLAGGITETKLQSYVASLHLLEISMIFPTISAVHFFVSLSGHSILVRINASQQEQKAL